jgi:hypothetical protein
MSQEPESVVPSTQSHPLRHDTFGLVQDVNDSGNPTPKTSTPLSFIINEHTLDQVPLALSDPSTPHVTTVKKLKKPLWLLRQEEREKQGIVVSKELEYGPGDLILNPGLFKTLNAQRLLDIIKNHSKYEEYVSQNKDLRELLLRREQAAWAKYEAEFDKNEEDDTFSNERQTTTREKSPPLKILTDQELRRKGFAWKEIDFRRNRWREEEELHKRNLREPQEREKRERIHMNS